MFSVTFRFAFRFIEFHYNDISHRRRSVEFRDLGSAGFRSGFVILIVNIPTISFNLFEVNNVVVSCMYIDEVFF